MQFSLCLAFSFSFLGASPRPHIRGDQIAVSRFGLSFLFCPCLFLSVSLNRLHKSYPLRHKLDIPSFHSNYYCCFQSIQCRLTRLPSLQSAARWELSSSSRSTCQLCGLRSTSSPKTLRRLRNSNYVYFLFSFDLQWSCVRLCIITRDAWASPSKSKIEGRSENCVTLVVAQINMRFFQPYYLLRLSQFHNLYSQFFNRTNFSKIYGLLMIFISRFLFLEGKILWGLD